jgi:hypothetical protein
MREISVAPQKREKYWRTVGVRKNIVILIPQYDNFMEIGGGIGVLEML